MHRRLVFVHDIFFCRAKRQVGLNESSIFLKIFLRHDLAYASEFKKYFREIQESYLNHESGFIVGIISLNQLKEIAARPNAASSIILIGVINSGYLNGTRKLKLPNIEYEVT